MRTHSLYRQVFERRITVVQFQMALDTGCGCTCSLKFRMICLISEIPLSLFRLPLLLLYLFLFKWHQLRRTEYSNVYGINHIQTCFFSSNYKIRMAISQSFSQPARKRCASKFRSGWGFFPNPYLDSCSLIPDIFLSFFFFFWKEVLEMSSPRLNEQLYTLLMVVDQNHHGDRKAAGHVDIQANCFLCHSFPSPQLSVSFHPPKHSNGRKRRQKSTFFPVRQWIGCPWRGGLWEGRAPRLWCCVAVGIF